MEIIHDIAINDFDHVGARFLDRTEPIRAGAAESEAFWRLSGKKDLLLTSHLDGQLEDYALALDAKPKDPVLILPRLQAILLATVSAAKRENIAQRRWTSEELNLLEYRPSVTLGQALTVPRPVNNTIHYLRSIADGILWYGSAESLEANLIIQKITNERDWWSAMLPPAMLMFHNSRMWSGRSPEIYGIVTNSYRWRFLWIDRNSKCFEMTLDWEDDDERQLIVNHLRDIVDKTMLLAVEKPSPLMEGDLSVYEISQCRVWRDKEESEQLLDDD